MSFNNDICRATIAQLIDAIERMRNHIAHGYFDIDADLVYDVVKNNLAPLKEALGDIAVCL